MKSVRVRCYHNECYYQKKKKNVQTLLHQSTPTYYLVGKNVRISTSISKWIEHKYMNVTNIDIKIRFKQINKLYITTYIITLMSLIKIILFCKIH